MKFSSHSQIICALLAATAIISAPPTARAQEQPRPAQRSISADAKVTFPTQFSALQFFDALADGTNARIVAPVPSDAQLAQLRAKMGGRTLTPPEIWPLYEQALGYRFATSQFEGDLVKVRLPDEMIYPTQTVDENYAAFLRLLVALSPAQIERMNLQNGLTVEDLTPEQIPLYLDARRKNANVAMVLSEDTTPLTDAQVLAQKVRFRFAFQAVAIFTPDDEVFGGLALFDYTTGLVWDPLVGADTKALEKSAYEENAAFATPVGQINKSSNSSEKSRATLLDYAKTHATTVGATLDDIEAKLGQTIVFDDDSRLRKVRATPIVVSAGVYHADELLDVVGASVGLQLVFLNDLPTLKKRPPQQPISQIPPLVEQGQAKLRRLSLQSSGVPFTPDRFDGKTVKYETLSGIEKFYLRAKLLNENTEGYDAIDLSKYTYRFENRLFFIGQTNDIDEPFVTSSLQLW